MPIKTYKELTVWQKGMELVHEVYKITKTLPTSEQFGLTSQMQRAAVAIPSNIAEGYMRNNRKEYVQFLGIARASAAELETQLQIAKNEYEKTNLLNAVTLDQEILKMLTVMIAKLKTPKP